MMAEKVADEKMGVFVVVLVCALLQGRLGFYCMIMFNILTERCMHTDREYNHVVE